jgi:hypothetical protein
LVLAAAMAEVLRSNADLSKELRESETGMRCKASSGGPE